MKGNVFSPVCQSVCSGGRSPCYQYLDLFKFVHLETPLPSSYRDPGTGPLPYSIQGIPTAPMPARIHLYSDMFKLVYLDLTIQPHLPLSRPAEKSFTRTHTLTYNLSLVLGSFSPADAGLKELERSLEKRRQREPAEGCWVKDMLYDVGETFGRDGCKDVKCTCHWDGQVSCRQAGNECEFSFSRTLLAMIAHSVVQACTPTLLTILFCS